MLAQLQVALILNVFYRLVMDEDGLKEQFHILQAQQQQKLLERRKKREGVNKDVDKKSEHIETFFGTFGTNDAFSLKVNQCQQIIL